MQLRASDLASILASLSLIESPRKPDLAYSSNDVLPIIQPKTSSHFAAKGATFLTQLGVSSNHEVNVNEEDCSVELYEAPTVTHQDFPPFDQVKANVYRYRKQQSVNLGSWSVLHATLCACSTHVCIT
jgi:glucan 1,3-beta-glucosidase